MISFSTATDSYYLSESSSLVIPLPDDRSCEYGTEDHDFYTAMKFCRDNDIRIRSVCLSNKHLSMLLVNSENLPHFSAQRTLFYTGDMAEFIIYNYANWLVA